MGLENVNFGRLDTINRSLSFNTRPDQQILDNLVREATCDGQIADFVPIYPFNQEDLRLRGKVFSTVLETYKDFLPKDQETVSGQLERAFYLAECAHQRQKRQSGENYIQHCLSVAQILAELGMPYQVVIAGLLHDTLEDTDLTGENIEKVFGRDGKEIRILVEGCRNSEWDVTEEDAASTIPDYEKLNQEQQRAVIKEAFDTLTLTKLLRQFLPKTLLSRDRDPRIPFIKLADRLHNLRTILGVTDERKRRKKAEETLEYYVPLARVLGWQPLATELEDLCFEVLEPEKYRMVRGLFFKFLRKPFTYESEDPYRHTKFVNAMKDAFKETTKGLEGLINSEPAFFEFPGIHAFYKSWLLENVKRGFLKPSDYLPEVKIIISAGHTSEKLVKSTADLVLRMIKMGYIPETPSPNHFEVSEGDITFLFKSRKHPKKLKVLFVTHGKFEYENRAVSDLYAVRKIHNEGAADKLSEISRDIDILLSSQERGERLDVLAKVLGGLKYRLENGREIWMPRDTNYAVYAYSLLGGNVTSLENILVDEKPIHPDFVNRPISHSPIRLVYYDNKNPYSMISPSWLSASDDPDYLMLIGDHLERKLGFFKESNKASEWEKEIRDIGVEKFARRLRNRPLVINLAYFQRSLQELGYDGKDNYASFFKDIAYGRIPGETVEQITQRFPLKGTDEWGRYTEFVENQKRESSGKKRKKHRRR